MDGKRMMILIVEDNPVSLKMLDIGLRNMGHDTLLTSSGDHALDCLNIRSDVKLIIADIEMPQMSGLELLKRIKDNPDTKDIPVIICSMKDDPRTIHEAINLGCNDYILKPVNFMILHQKIENIFRDKADIN